MMDEFGISIRDATNADGEAVRGLVFRILREYGLEPDRKGIDRDLDDLEASYIDRGGLFRVLEDRSGTIVGTVGLYPLDEGEIELRKMYFDKAIRGQGLGRKLLAAVVDAARDLGFSRISLETASVLKEAIGLYASFGFIEQTGTHADRCDKAFYLDL